MRTHMTVWLRTVVLAIFFACTPGHILTSTSAAPRAPTIADLPTLPADIGTNPLKEHGKAVRLPVAFEKNDGQFPGSLAFSVRTSNGRVGITRGGAVTVTAPRVAGSGEHHFTPFHLHGASSAVAVGLDQLPTHVRYMRGSNPALWVQD